MRLASLSFENTDYLERLFIIEGIRNYAFKFGLTEQDKAHLMVLLSNPQPPLVMMALLGLLQEKDLDLAKKIARPILQKRGDFYLKRLAAYILSYGETKSCDADLLLKRAMDANEPIPLRQVYLLSFSLPC